MLRAPWRICWEFLRRRSTSSVSTVPWTCSCPQRGVGRILEESPGELFALEYDLLLYDVTSTYFEGFGRGQSACSPRLFPATIGPDLQAGVHRPGGHEVRDAAGLRGFCRKPRGRDDAAGDGRNHGATVRPGRSDLGWRSGDDVRRQISPSSSKAGDAYIIGASKSMLKQFERELLAEDWHAIRDGLEVKLCPTPDGDETFVLCRSRDRREKEKAMHGRFEQRIEEGLVRIASSCKKQRLEAIVVAGACGPAVWAKTAVRQDCFKPRSRRRPMAVRTCNGKRPIAGETGRP